jgi:hypothetical protein
VTCPACNHRDRVIADLQGDLGAAVAERDELAAQVEWLAGQLWEPGQAPALDARCWPSAGADEVEQWRVRDAEVPLP